MSTTPRFSMMNGQEVREQTLDEFLEVLDKKHCARIQLEELRDALKAQVEEIEQLKKDKLDIVAQIDDLSAKFKASVDANGELVAEIKKHRIREKNAAATLKRKRQANPVPEPRPEGDAGDSL